MSKIQLMKLFVFNEIPNTIELNEGKFRIEKKNTLFGAAIQTTFHQLDF
jgi:hypothetical protein